jgi:hypothetical protein
LITVLRLGQTVVAARRLCRDPDETGISESLDN